MNKLKVKISILTELPIQLDKRALEKCKSSIFEISTPIETNRLTADADIGPIYSDHKLNELFSKIDEVDFAIALVRVPLQDNFYARFVGEHKIVLSLYEMKDILESKNIPLENLVLRVIYAYSLIFFRLKEGTPIRVPAMAMRFTHDDTRGCLFDVNVNKYDAVYACNKPLLCSECEHRFLTEGVTFEKIQLVKSEIKKIKRSTFYDIADFIKAHPIQAVVISTLWAFFVGILGNIVADYLWKVLYH